MKSLFATGNPLVRLAPARPLLIVPITATPTD